MGKNTICQDFRLQHPCPGHLNFQDRPPQIAFTLGQYSGLLPYHSVIFDCQMALPQKNNLHAGCEHKVIPLFYTAHHLEHIALRL